MHVIGYSDGLNAFDWLVVLYGSSSGSKSKRRYETAVLLIRLPNQQGLVVSCL